jgi:hypothetical protein
MTSPSMFPPPTGIVTQLNVIAPQVSSSVANLNNKLQTIQLLTKKLMEQYVASWSDSEKTAVCSSIGSIIKSNNDQLSALINNLVATTQTFNDALDVVGSTCKQDLSTFKLLAPHHESNSSWKWMTIFFALLFVVAIAYIMYK